MRTTKFQQYHEEGGNTATTAAWDLFVQLKERQLVTVYQMTSILTFCHDSKQM